jgi:hypothetical protein
VLLPAKCEDLRGIEKNKEHVPRLVIVIPDGENLVLEAKAEPPQSVLDALSRHKFAILALMPPSQSGWSAEHWLAYSTNAPQSPSPTTDCRVRKPKRGPRPVA